MHARTAYPRRLIAVFIAVAALTTPAAGAGIAGDDSSGFLRDRPPAVDGVRATGAGEIVHELICAEDCIVSGRIVIGARAAERLGLGPVDGRWLSVGHFQDVELKARTWQRLKVRLGRRVERRLRSSRVRLYGEAVAISVQSQRHGSAGWTLGYSG
jgi:hypothetical protein